MSVSDWKCPICEQNAQIPFCDWSGYKENKLNPGHVVFGNRSSLESFKNEVKMDFFTCPNPKCEELFCYVYLYNKNFSREPNEKIKEWQLCPEPTGKPSLLKDYILEAILEDYKEACLIKDKSPKAAATLARRCLQGMIRDFFGVKNKNTLKEEIDSIKNEVAPEVWKAIHTIRSIGNIGAHMEEDVNLIIDIDSKEAEKLIWLIEFLLEKWYIDREEKKQKSIEDKKRLEEVAEMGKQKESEKKKKEALHQETE